VGRPEGRHGSPEGRHQQLDRTTKAGSSDHSTSRLSFVRRALADQGLADGDIPVLELVGAIATYTDELDG
jgi:hypothetical protein